MRKFGYSSEIYEFETNGFVRSSYSYTLCRLRIQYGKYLRIFNSEYGRTRAKYGTRDIFGDKIYYYYDIRRKKEFIDFLVGKFYEKNQNPDADIRSVFTRILHAHKLHWFGCRHGGKDRYDTSKNRRLKVNKNR